MKRKSPSRRRQLASEDLRETTVTILGTGAVAEALAVHLARAGTRLVLWSRSSRRASAMRNSVLAGARGSAQRVRAEGNLSGAFSNSHAAIFAVPDGALEDLAADCARAWPAPPRGAIALHTSGYHEPEILQALIEEGCQVAALHPLVSLAKLSVRARREGRSPSLSLEGATCTVAGDPAAVAFGRRILELFDGHELRLAGDVSRAVYHAAAALLANGTVALFDAAHELLAEETGRPEVTRAALAGLLTSVVDNLLEGPPGAALTGPVARGDIAVVRGHLAALKTRADTRVQGLYEMLSRRMIQLAEERGTVPPEDLRKLEKLLNSEGVVTLRRPRKMR